MSIQSRTNIKENFKQFKRPKQADYHNWIDSFIHKNGEDGLSIDQNGNIGIGVVNPETKLDINGAIHFSATGDYTILYTRTNENGSPLDQGDGFRLRLENGFFGASRDGIIFEKTDANQPDPDGGFAFVNTGSDGVVETSMVIRGNGNVGIGTKTPERALHIQGTGGNNDDVIIDSRGDNNSGGLIFYKSTGTIEVPNSVKQGNSLGLIAFRGNTGTSMSDTARIEAFAESNFDRSVSGSLRFTTSRNGQLVEAMIINERGNVGIGTDDPKNKLHVEGNIMIANNATILGYTYMGSNAEVEGDLFVGKTIINPKGRLVTPSDSRVKKDIKDFKEGLQTLKKLRPVTFKYNGKGVTPKGDNVYHGFIAQEVEKVCPYMIEKYSSKLNEDDMDETELLTLNTNALDYLLVNAIVELDKRLTQLEKK